MTVTAAHPHSPRPAAGCALGGDKMSCLLGNEDVMCGQQTKKESRHTGVRENHRGTGAPPPRDRRPLPGGQDSERRTGPELGSAATTGQRRLSGVRGGGPRTPQHSAQCRVPTGTPPPASCGPEAPTGCGSSRGATAAACPPSTGRAVGDSTQQTSTHRGRPPRRPLPTGGHGPVIFTLNQRLHQTQVPARRGGREALCASDVGAGGCV